MPGTGSALTLALPDPPLQWPGGQLRSWTDDDAPALVRAWQDPEIAAWNQVPAEPTLATARHWISGESQRLARRLSVDLVIVSDGHSGVVGEVGFSGFSDTHNGAFIGYWLLPEARGHGLAAAAVAACTQWAHIALSLDVIVARCDPDNVASQRVAARAGFQHGTNDPLGNQLWKSRTRAA